MSTSKAVQILGEGVKIGEGFSFVQLAATALLNVDSVAAAGSTITDGGQLTTGVSLVTGANNTKAVLLPAITSPGEICFVVNTGESNTLEIFPDAAGTSINAASAGAAFTTPAMSIFIAIAASATQWYAGEIVVAAV